MHKSTYSLASVLVGFLGVTACATSTTGTPDGGGNGPDASASSSGSGSGSGSSGSSGASSGSGSGGSSGSSTGSSSGGSSGSSSGASSGGSSGAAADGGSSGGGDSWLSTPTPANSKGSFPFPQDRRSPSCTYPAKISHAQIQGAYQSWLTAMVTTTGAGSGERVQDPGTSNETTSEGIAYGMLITVYMADKTHFDKLWAYAQAHLSGGLMSWHIDSSGNPVSGGGSNSASDADEDMAWALLMADKQWPGGYASAAKTLLGNIKSQDINGSNNVKDGNFNGAGSTHPDYAAPDYYKGFATASGDSSWNSVTTAEYSQLTGAQNGTTGLIPDALNGGTFGFDACRAPWRVGLDYCWSGSSQAQGFLTKMVAYFMQTSASGATPSNIKIPVATGGGTGQYNTGAITGPAAIAAMMSASNQTLLNNSWTYLYSLVANATSPGNLNYFSSTLGLISMLALSGNFVDYTNPP